MTARHDAIRAQAMLALGEQTWALLQAWAHRYTDEPGRFQVPDMGDDDLEAGIREALESTADWLGICRACLNRTEGCQECSPGWFATDHRDDPAWVRAYDRS